MIRFQHMQSAASLSLNTELLARELAELDRVLHRIQARLAPAQKPRTRDIAETLRNTAGRVSPARAQEMMQYVQRSRAEWDAREEQLAQFRTSKES